MIRTACNAHAPHAMGDNVFALDDTYEANTSANRRNTGSHPNA